MVVQSVRYASIAGVALGVTNRLPDAVSFYLKWHEIEGHTKATVRAYRMHLEPFVEWLQVQGLPLEVTALTAFHILAYLSEPRKDGQPRSPGYNRTIYQHVNSFLNWCVDWGLIEEGKNPASRVKPPKVPKVRKPFLKPDHPAKLLALCPLNTFLGSRRQAMLWLLFTTGMRRMEISSLHLDDIDWDAQLVNIRMGKGQKDRVVPLHRQVQRPLHRHLAFRDDRRPELWLTEERRPLSYWGVGQDIERLMRRAGIRGDIKDVCHIFRRTWAANAVRQNIPRPYVQAIGGWEKPEMIDKYTEAMLEEGDQAIDAFRDFDPLADGRQLRRGRSQ